MSSVNVSIGMGISVSPVEDRKLMELDQEIHQVAGEKFPGQRFMYRGMGEGAARKIELVPGFVGKGVCAFEAASLMNDPPKVFLNKLRNLLTPKNGQ